jgi:glycosyltransferase involved in cell wall biosynthesis
VRICVIGKFPPIQGGVSMRTYWTAHALAARGHEVHVVTNAKEVQSPFRMHMRADDWARCESQDGTASLTVHWTDPVDRSQSHIPMGSPFVTKLATLAARAHAERPFDVIYSHYLEPYGVAGHLAAQMTGLRHVVRMAGSDAGRLWQHPQFELLYDHVLQSAEAVIASGPVAERAVAHGVAPKRVVAGGAFAVPEHLFAPQGPRVDLAALPRDIAHDPDLAPLLWGEYRGNGSCFGVYGKLGERKGSFALLAALHRLKQAGIDVGLIVLAHGEPPIQAAFRDRARELGLVDRILQIPFLPHWRVPEFLRRCLAVCCFEQDFPIAVHAPIIPREVLMSGTCLVGSTEVIRKLPSYEQLPHGYGCVAIEDVNDIDLVSERLATLVREPETAAAIGARGRAFALEVQRHIPFPDRLESILAAAAQRQRRSDISGAAAAVAPVETGDRFLLTRLVAALMAKLGSQPEILRSAAPAGLPWARQVLSTVEQRMAGGVKTLQPLALAVQVEIAVATAEEEADAAGPVPHVDPLFRLHANRWAMKDCDVAELVPVRDPRLRIIRFEFDVAQFLRARSVAELPLDATPRPSFVAIFASCGGERRDPLLVDELTAEILRLSDGALTASEILAELGEEAGPSGVCDDIKWIENLFRLGLISLRDSPVRDDAVVAARHVRLSADAI